MIFQNILADIDGGKVLDAACGTGQFTETLIKFLKSYDTITGIDVSEKSIAEASKKFPGNEFRFLVVDAEELPFEDERFDMAVISKALHHVENPEATLSELKRVIKPGGHLLIIEMHRDDLSESQSTQMLYHHLRSEIDNALGISHNTTFYRDDLIQLSKDLNLCEREILEFVPNDYMEDDAENRELYINRMDNWIPELDGLPEKEKFIEKIEEINSRIRKFGISRPPHMLFLGRK